MKDNKFIKYLQPEVVSTLSNLELIARLVVEGYLTGLHKSPFHGFSVEFSQHRPYMAGDSLRFIDWKVYGRTDRYYIKQYEEETNLRCHILLDISKSMEYGSGRVSKAKYAACLAAALSFLMIQQRDATGLVLFDDRIRKILPPKSVFSYLNPILSAIDSVEYGKDTMISPVLHQVAEQLKRRGLVIIISDLLDNPEDVLAGLKHFRYDQHEALVFHVIDEQEKDFNFSGDVVFEDIESSEKIKTQPWYIRESYQERFNQFLDYYKHNFSNNRIGYQQLYTNTPFNVALTEYLLKRKRMF
jgi:uncharacterized protein (DUF58 family)